MLHMLALYRGRQADALRAFQVNTRSSRRGPRDRPFATTAAPRRADPVTGRRTSTLRSPRRLRPVRRGGEPVHGPARLPRVGRIAVLRTGRARRAALRAGARALPPSLPSSVRAGRASRAPYRPDSCRGYAGIRRTSTSPCCSPGLSRSPSSRRPSIAPAANVRAIAQRSCAHGQRDCATRRSRCSAPARRGCWSWSTSSKSCSHSRSAEEAEHVPRRTRRRRAGCPVTACTCSSRSAPTSTTGRSPHRLSGRSSPRTSSTWSRSGPTQLEAATTLPAASWTSRSMPRLVGRLIADVAGQPNTLPLFQYTLTELFDERAGLVLDLATYERIGGVREPSAPRQSFYTKLDGPEQDTVRQLFLRIATVSGNAVGRRRYRPRSSRRSTVDIVALQQCDRLVRALAPLALDRDRPRVRPLSRSRTKRCSAEWHRLHDWIDESREDLAMHCALRVPRCKEWEASERDSGYLLSGAGSMTTNAGPRRSQLKLQQPSAPPSIRRSRRRGRDGAHTSASPKPANRSGAARADSS